MKHNIELSSLEVSILRAALAMYANETKRKAEPTEHPRAATNSIQVAVTISGLDNRLAQLEQ